MPDFVVIDIETYRPDWRTSKMLPRREDLDPAKNSIITIGFYDGNEMSIYPVIDDLKKEEKLIEFFSEKLLEFSNLDLVGYNILRFDIPYLAHKVRSIGKEFNPAQLKPFDLYWVLPFWFHNTPSGQTFFAKFSQFGNLWKFENVVEHLLKRTPNPFSNKEIFELWEKKEFGKIEKHLELDLANAYLLLKSEAMVEVRRQLQNLSADRSECRSSCPFLQFLSSSDNVSYYCTLRQEIKLGETTLCPIDVIDSPLPKRDVSWAPSCVERG